MDWNVTITWLESGSDWAHIIVRFPTFQSKYIDSVVALIIASLSSPSTTASEIEMFGRLNITRFAAHRSYASEHGYNGGNYITGQCLSAVSIFNLRLALGAKAELDGIVLQWTRLQEPVQLNLIQYRPIANVTAAFWGTDVTPFVSLPIAFESAATTSMKVPLELLSPSVHYEFRLTFPYQTHTYFTNVVSVRALEPTAGSVTNVTSTSTAYSISLRWNEPVFSESLAGYKVSVYYQTFGNGLISAEQWHSNDQQLLLSVTRGPGTKALVLGCIEMQDALCLTANTTYLVQIDSLRDDSVQSSTLHFATTEIVVPKVVLVDEALMYPFIGRIDVRVISGIPQYNGTLLNETIFVPSLFFLDVGRVLSLQSSTITSLSSSTAFISMSEFEAEELTKLLLSTSYISSDIELRYDGSSAIAVSFACLTMSSFSPLLFCFRSAQC
jgi:hypothetical protein